MTEHASEVDFLVGRVVKDVVINSERDARVVFEVGDRPEPALYADVADVTFVDGTGAPRPLADLVGLSVTKTSTEAGTLRLAFDDRSELECRPDRKYEAWQVVGGDPQYLVVALGGGELAVWDARHVPSPDEAHEIINTFFGPGFRVREITESGGIVVEPETEADSTD